MADGGKLDHEAAPAETLVALGSEARQVRKARGLTLREVSAASGISLSHLSAVERGTANPSVATLHALAAALGVTPDWFFTRRPGKGPYEQAHVVRAENRRSLNTLYGEDDLELGFADELLSASISGAFYMGLSTYGPYSTRTIEGMRCHDGEEHGLVIEGELEMRIGDEIITLRTGDSFSYDARIPHRARNRTDRVCRLIWATAPVVIPKLITETLADDGG